MKTCDEIRRKHLADLSDEHGGHAALTRVLGRKDRDNTVNQYINAVPDSKTGKPKFIGHEFAREVERALNLERGFMDTDPELAPWPFKSVSRDEYFKLDEWQRAGIEKHIAEFIASTNKPFTPEPPIVRKSSNGG